MYEYLLPKLCRRYDPNTFYWPASPSSGGAFDKPNDENRGDAHYWDVWHGNKPFTEYRKFYFRYVSEFGFQSFPSLKTCESFTRAGGPEYFLLCDGEAPAQRHGQWQNHELPGTDLPVSHGL